MNTYKAIVEADGPGEDWTDVYIVQAAHSEEAFSKVYNRLKKLGYEAVFKITILEIDISKPYFTNSRFPYKF